MAPVRAVALLLILCLLLATEARGRTMDGAGEKISLPNGLCVHDEKSSACRGDKPFCYCCRVGYELCYETMDACKRQCVKNLAAPPPAGGGGGNTSPLA